MSIRTDFDPVSMNICIFSGFDQKRPLKQRSNIETAEQMVQRRTIPNKMTECIFNALAFLLYLDLSVRPECPLYTFEIK